MDDLSEHDKVSIALMYVGRIMNTKGIPIRLKRISYFQSQPSVLYCTFVIGEEVIVVRVFDGNFKTEVYPAKVVNEIVFEEMGKVTQVINPFSYDVIGIGENEIGKSPIKIKHKWRLALDLGAAAFNYTSLINTAATLLKYFPFSALYIVPVIAVSFIALCALVKEKFFFLKIYKNYKKGKYNTKKGEHTLSSSFIIQDVAISSLNKQIKEATEQNKRIIIGIETDWIADNRSKEHVKKTIKELNRKYKGKIKIIHSNNKNIVSDVITEHNRVSDKEKINIPPSNMVIISGSQSLYDKEFQYLRKHGISLIVVDNSKIETARMFASKGQALYINVIKILDISLRMVLKRQDTLYDVELRYSSEADQNFAVIIPNPFIDNIDAIERIYKSERKALRYL